MRMRDSTAFVAGANWTVLAEQLGPVVRQFRLMSVFAYGSSVRELDSTAASDVELGMIPVDGQTVSRRLLAQGVEQAGVRAYVFDEESLRCARPRVPFNPRLFTRELAESGCTIVGKSVVESLVGPEITALDLFDDVRFSVGRAFEALLNARAGQVELAADAFAKSTIYGCRALIAHRRGMFLVGHNVIATEAREVLGSDHRALLDHAVRVRSVPRFRPDPQAFYDLLEFLTETIEPPLRELCESNPRTVLVAQSSPRGA